MGLNEFAGYLAVAPRRWPPGTSRRPWSCGPAVLPGRGFAVVGWSSPPSWSARRRPRRARGASTRPGQAAPSQRQVFMRTSFTDRSLSSVSQAGSGEQPERRDGLGLFPLVFAAARHVSPADRNAGCPLPRGLGSGQLVTGALSDRVGRKWLIAKGMWGRQPASRVVAGRRRLRGFSVGGLLLGTGTAMVYPGRSSPID